MIDYVELTLKYSDDYKMIVRTSQEPSETKGNLFLFTAERVCEYDYFSSVDFLVIDEFYKLSGKRDDERSSSLNNAFYKIISCYKPQFYLLGPNIDKVSLQFLKKYNAIFFHSQYSLVDSQVIDVYKEHEGEFGSRGEKYEKKLTVLFDLLQSLKNEQTIIYCSSPERVRKLAKAFCQSVKDKDDFYTTEEYPLIEWIKENVSDSWMLIDALNHDVGIHDGALQKHITTSIIDYFNKGKLKYLFCTSTIIEGVNTSAKNIIYFDFKKGDRPVDFFDYSNY